MFDVLGRIKEIQEARGWSSYRLSKETGIPQSTISTWYVKNLCPPIDKLETICEALGVTLAQFFSSDPSKRYEDDIASKVSRLSASQRRYIDKTIEILLH